MAKLQAKQRMKNLLMFIPNMIALCGRLMTDSRVPVAEKALLLGAIVYAISPLDLIPDMIPFVGQMDDAYLLALTILRLVNRTDEQVVREHWRGGGDIVRVAESVARAASLILPKGVRRVLTSHVEAAPEAKHSLLNVNVKGRRGRVLVEVPEQK